MLNEFPKHRLLRRQMHRHLAGPEGVSGPCRELLLEVDAAYHEFDNDRAMLERSLELSSQELLQANSELVAIFGAIPDLLFRVDTAGRIISSKTGGRDEPLLAAGVKIGQRIQEGVLLAAGPQFDEALRRAMEKRTLETVEFPFGNNHYECRVVPVAGSEALIIVRNITEHRQLEEKLLQSQKMEAIGQLAGGVAHDFNNLLTVIQGNLSLIRDCGLTGQEAAIPLEQCAQAAKRAANLTRQLLTFSRREQVSLKPLDLNAVVAEMTKMCRRLVGEHIQIETSYAPGRMPVLADAGSIEQALMNLVVNSRDAMPQGGRLLIKTTPATISPDQASQHPFGRPGDYVRLSVTDTGCGIPPELLPRIFEPFFTTKEAGKGTGLGLATVFGILQQHKGWTEVVSEVRVGTTFHLYLPRHDEAAAADGSSPAETSAAGGRETILVVEDEPMVREWMAKLLARYGYTVTAAASGQEAIRLFSLQEGRFDLVITDMVMPGGISGRDLGESLKARHPGLKVLYCSGYSDEFLGGNDSLRGTSKLLAKPFEAPELLQRVREKLDGD